MNAFRHGLELFNRGEFFDAHEVLEDVWRAAPPPEKKFLQGLIQVAVGLHHYSRGNLAGARSLLARAARNLDDYGDHHGGIELARFRRSVLECSQSLAEGDTLSRLPTLDLSTSV
jgi:predicted metal-dependent hydrolase